MLDSQYGSNPSAAKRSDLLLLAVVVILLGLLLGSGQADDLSLGVGLCAGMTIIQTYFTSSRHPYPDTAERPGDVNVSPIKQMSYAIQASPGRPWQQLAIITVVAMWVWYWLALG